MAFDCRYEMFAVIAEGEIKMCAKSIDDAQMMKENLQKLFPDEKIQIQACKVELM